MTPNGTTEILARRRAAYPNELSYTWTLTKIIARKKLRRRGARLR